MTPAEAAAAVIWSKAAATSGLMPSPCRSASGPLYPPPVANDGTDPMLRGTETRASAQLSVRTGRPPLTLALTATRTLTGAYETASGNRTETDQGAAPLAVAIRTADSRALSR